MFILLDPIQQMSVENFIYVMKGIGLHFSLVMLCLTFVSEKCWSHRMTWEFFLSFQFGESVYVELLLVLP